jgi:hypothetical protein
MQLIVQVNKFVHMQLIHIADLQLILKELFFLNQKGLFFSLEAVVCLLILVSFVSFSAQKPVSFEALTLSMAQGDLFSVWALQPPSESEMIADCKCILGSCEIVVDNSIILTTEKKINAISISAVFAYPNNVLKKITLTSYYD